LLSIYQLDAALIENGEFANEVGMDTDVVGPTCEYSTPEGDLLIHGYDLRFSSRGRTISLASNTEGSLPSSDSASSWRIQTGALTNTLVDPNADLLDVQAGEFFHFVAWTEPQ
jgi:hypothetical protein